jgi:hypothetical protein
MLVSLLLSLAPPACRACCQVEKVHVDACCSGPQGAVHAPCCAQSSAPALREDRERLAPKGDLAVTGSFLTELGISVPDAGSKAFAGDRSRPRPPGVLRI